MAFNRDMLINIPLIANLTSIADPRQALIDENLIQVNAKRIQYNYKVNDRVTMVEYDPPTKLEAKTHGPYTITQVFTNATVNIQRSQHVQERVNIRKLYPYTGP